MSLEITFLGTGSAYPTPTRGASCTIFRLDGTYWMFDCGEGSQIQLMRSTIRPGRISKIFITHLHGDHMFGLPGLLCTISQNFCPETKPTVELYGPKGLRKFVRASLQLSRSQLGFDFIVHELEPTVDQLPDDWEAWFVNHEADGLLHPNEKLGLTISVATDGLTWNVCADDQLIVKAGKLDHRIPCFGYVIEEKTLPGRLNVDKLRSMCVMPGPVYSLIKSGQTVTAPSGDLIEPSEVMGPCKPGRKVAVLGDTRDSHKMASLCHGVDVLIHEATLSNCMQQSAVDKGHSTPEMAGQFATSIGAGYLVLTHVSQRFKLRSSLLKDGEESIDVLQSEAQSAFPGGQVIAVEDFTALIVAAKSDENVPPAITVQNSQTSMNTNICEKATETQSTSVELS